MKKVLLPILIAGALITLSITSVQRETSNIVSKEQAITLIKNTFPIFEDYPSDNLPPKRIEVLEVSDGWRIGMYVEGSGVRGILRADCFLVTTSGDIVETGLFQGEGPARSINLSTCVPNE